MNDDKKIYEGIEKIYTGNYYEFILEHPVKIINVVKGNHNGNITIRVLSEDGDDKPIFLIQKKDEEKLKGL